MTNKMRQTLVIVICKLRCEKNNQTTIQFICCNVNLTVTCGLKDYAAVSSLTFHSLPTKDHPFFFVDILYLQSDVSYTIQIMFSFFKKEPLPVNSRCMSFGINCQSNYFLTLLFFNTEPSDFCHKIKVVIIVLSLSSGSSG